MLVADDELTTVLICGGYRNSDVVNFRDPGASFMYNLAAGASALIVKTGYDKNLVRGSQIVTDGTMARDVGVRLLGTEQPIEQVDDATLTGLREGGNSTLEVFDADHMNARLGEVSMPSWVLCLDHALQKSGGLTREDLGFLNILHSSRRCTASCSTTSGSPRSSRCTSTNTGT